MISLQNAGIFWTPEKALLGDVATFVCSVDAGLRGYKCDPDWIESLRQKDDKKEAANRCESQEKVLLLKSVEWLTLIRC